MKLEKLTLPALSNGVVEKLAKGEPEDGSDEADVKGLDGPPGFDVVLGDVPKAGVVSPEKVETEDAVEDATPGSLNGVRLVKVEGEATDVMAEPPERMV